MLVFLSACKALDFWEFASAGANITWTYVWSRREIRLGRSARCQRYPVYLLSLLALMACLVSLFARLPC